MILCFGPRVFQNATAPFYTAVVAFEELGTEEGGGVFLGSSDPGVVCAALLSRPNSVIIKKVAADYLRSQQIIVVVGYVSCVRPTVCPRE